jgi:hypothetical protein
MGEDIRDHDPQAMLLDLEVVLETASIPNAMYMYFWAV